MQSALLRPLLLFMKMMIFQSVNKKQGITLILCSLQLGLIFSGSIGAETVYFRDKRVAANYRFHKATALTITLRREDGKLVTYNKKDIKRIEWDYISPEARKELEKKKQQEEFKQAVLLKAQSPELAQLSPSEKKEYAEEIVEKEKRELKKAFEKAVRSPEFTHLSPSERRKEAEKKAKQERAAFEAAVIKEIDAPEFSNLAPHERREYAEEKIKEEKEALQEAVEDAIESEELAHLSPRERQRQAEIKAKRKIRQKRRKKEQEFKKLILLEESQSPEAAHLPPKEKRKYAVKKAAWKRCWLRSFLLPGAGQFCAYEYGKGWTYLSLSALSLTTALVAANQYSVEVQRHKELKGRLLNGEDVSQGSIESAQVTGNAAAVLVVLSYSALASLYTMSIVDTFIDYPTVPEKRTGYSGKSKWEKTPPLPLPLETAKKDSPKLLFSFRPSILSEGGFEMEGSLRVQSYF